MTKTAVHFGAGAIGRGFVGVLLHKSGYEVVFVDVVDKVIDDLQSQKDYTVTEISADGEQTSKVTGYRAVNSKHHREKAEAEIAAADVVTCAVGVNVLKFIAPVIAKGLEQRTSEQPVTVIACENALNATSTLRELVEKDLSAEAKGRARFANCAIDRIVPTVDPNSGLNVKIEKFFEWCVEKKPFDGSPPRIEGVHYVDDLQPYIERKLFTVNTGHATTAYFGHRAGKTYVHEAMADKAIHDTVRDTLGETARYIVKTHGIGEREQQEYVDTIIARFSNAALQDDVKRVGRAPLRKLSRNERFVAPAAALAERGDKVDCLLAAIEMALRFQDVDGDDESAELARILKGSAAKDATAKITGLEESHPLFAQVQKVVEKVQKA